MIVNKNKKNIYDLLAKRVNGYGLIYPFLELALGLGYLSRWNPTVVYAATVVLMLLTLFTTLLTSLTRLHSVLWSGLLLRPLRRARNTPGRDGWVLRPAHLTWQVHSDPICLTSSVGLSLIRPLEIHSLCNANLVFYLAYAIHFWIKVYHLRKNKCDDVELRSAFF